MNKPISDFIPAKIIANCGPVLRYFHAMLALPEGPVKYLLCVHQETGRLIIVKNTPWNPLPGRKTNNLVLASTTGPRLNANWKPEMQPNPTDFQTFVDDMEHKLRGIIENAK